MGPVPVKLQDRGSNDSSARRAGAGHSVAVSDSPGAHGSPPPPESSSPPDQRESGLTRGLWGPQWGSQPRLGASGHQVEATCFCSCLPFTSAGLRTTGHRWPYRGEFAPTKKIFHKLHLAANASSHHDSVKLCA